MKAAFFVTPFPGNAGGSVQPFFGQTAASLSGRNTGSPSPCFCRFHPASTDLQNNGPASGTLPAPDLTVP
ncbi:hypothetical protein ECZU08_55490 [Escherichia coli]|nr:hypothetical protein ECZU08_55490 [Escherichia coli]GHK90302.1 hypothetical protein ECZU17_62390 [Escherichia coli]GHL84637.1 hypothetical protein ECZU36_59210 [Escherichia coli]